MRQRRAQSERAAAEGVLQGSTEVSRLEPIRSGDVLVIEITGEPDVPRAYRVSSEGTIRLPLSPAIRVLGLSGSQVEQLIVKQLSARGLQQADVAVVLRRPKGE
jgi:protein involved in polysaccharide export with SLBB domain